MISSCSKAKSSCAKFYSYLPRFRNSDGYFTLSEMQVDCIVSSLGRTFLYPYQQEVSMASRDQLLPLAWLMIICLSYGLSHEMHIVVVTSPLVTTKDSKTPPLTSLGPGLGPRRNDYQAACHMTLYVIRPKEFGPCRQTTQFKLACGLGPRLGLSRICCNTG